MLYLLSHMAIMPLIDLLLTVIEWLPHGSPAPGLWLFIGLSFSNGCVLELGRKIWAPESERPGVDTYSGLWGPQKAVLIWLIFVVISWLLLVGVGMATGHLFAVGLIGTLGLLACFWAGRGYLRGLSAKDEKRVDSIAGLWVFLCYATAGFVPLLLGSSG